MVTSTTEAVGEVMKAVAVVSSSSRGKRPPMRSRIRSPRPPRRWVVVVVVVVRTGHVGGVKTGVVMVNRVVVVVVICDGGGGVVVLGAVDKVETSDTLVVTAIVVVEEVACVVVVELGDTIMLVTSTVLRSVVVDAAERAAWRVSVVCSTVELAGVSVKLAASCVLGVLVVSEPDDWTSEAESTLYDTAVAVAVVVPPIGWQRKRLAST
jgi:hypothetical protein